MAQPQGNDDDYFNGIAANAAAQSQGASTPQSPQNSPNVVSQPPISTQTAPQQGSAAPATSDDAYFNSIAQSAAAQKQQGPSTPQQNQGASTPPQQNPGASTPQSNSDPNQPGFLSSVARILPRAISMGPVAGPVSVILGSQAAQNSPAAVQAQSKKEDAALGTQVGQPSVSYNPDQLSASQKVTLNSKLDYNSQAAAFKQMFPGGQIQQITEKGQSEPTTLIKPDPNGQWVRLTPSNMRQWDAWYQTIGTATNPDQRNAKFVAAITDYLENNPVQSAESVVFGLIWGPEAGPGKTYAQKAIPYVTNLGRAVLGAGAVRGAAATASAVQGQPTGGVSANASQAAYDGFNAWISALAAQTMVQLARVTQGGGLLKMSQEAREAMQNAADLQKYVKDNNLGADVQKYLRLMPSQVIPNPMLRRIVNRARAIIPTIQEFERGQQASAYAVGASHVDKNALEAGLQTTGPLSDKSGTIPEAVNQYQKDALTGKLGPQAPQNPHQSLPGAAAATEGDLSTYADRSKPAVDAAYAHARSLEEPKYDLSPALAAVSDVETGVHTLTNYEKTPINTGDAQYTQINKESSPIRQPSAQLQQLIARVRQVAQNPLPVAVKQADGTMKTDSVTDQLRTLQQDAYYLAEPGAGNEVRNTAGDQSALAMKIYKGITDTLNNVKNTNPEFRQAWTEANGLAQQRFQNLQSGVVKRGVAQDEGTRLAGSVGSIQQMTADSGRGLQQLQQLQKTVTPETYQKVLDAKKTELLDDPNKITTHLNKMTPELQKAIFQNPTELQQYKDLGTVFDNLNSSGIKDEIKNQTNTANFIDGMIKRGQQDTQAFRTLQQVVKMQPDSPAAQSVRAGVMDKLMYDALVSDTNGKTLSGQDFTRWLNDADRKGYLQFLTKDDIEHMTKLKSFLDYTQGAGRNVGDSFAAAGEASRISHLEHEALVLLAENAGIGHLMTSEKFTNLLAGTGGPRMSGNVIKAIAAAYSTQHPGFAKAVGVAGLTGFGSLVSKEEDKLDNARR